MNKKLFSLFLIFLSIISFSFSETCTEQWSEIELENWTFTGDVNITNDEKGLNFEFERKETITSNSDIGGAVWNTYDFSQKKGLHISFKPTVKSDYAYTGNQKYPQGFAIVFTSSSIENLIGEKGSGIGYEGIMNSVVFEFDFIKQTSNDDLSKPHFSVHYNVNGAVSSSSVGFDKDLTNRPIPNFYDNSQDGYYKSIIFEIELIGNRIVVKSNRSNNKIVDATFTGFQQLLEQKDVHVGITASMNQNKKIVVSDFKISEISTKDKANLEVRDASSIKAGEDIVLLYSINSICDQKLKIYPEEYSSDQFVLKINNNVVKPNSIGFNEETVEVEIKVTENLADTYTAFVDFGNHISAPTKFTVVPNDVVRYELCHVDEKNPYNITNELDQTKDYFTLYICAYDQYDNPKKIKYSGFEPRVQYPDNLLPDLGQITKETDSSSRQLMVNIPFSSFGLYKIFNENFIESKIRYLNLMPEYISPEYSEISLLYENNVVNGIGNILKIEVKDNYGRHIPGSILQQLGCDFSSSKIKEDSSMKVTSEISSDFVLLTVKEPSDKQKYTFVPQVKCKNIPLTELNCGNNPVTKLNNCEFYSQSTLNTKKVKAFSDFTDTYFTYESGKAGQPLIISLDESENKKITEILLLDDKDSVYLKPSTTEVRAKLSGSKEESLTVVPLGHKYAVILPEGKTRDNYPPTATYQISLSVGSNTITIPVRFYYLNHYMNNVDTSDKTVDNYIAFYKQPTYTLKASDTYLLFQVFELTSSGFLGSGATLDVKKVELSINSNKAQIETFLESNFITVINHELTKAGLYTLELKYNSKSIAKVNLEITPKDEAHYFGNEEGVQLTEAIIGVGVEELKKLTLLDKFGNILKNNQVFKAFGKIKISNSDVFTVRPNFDGKIHIFNDGKNKISSISMKLESGKDYSIKNTYTPTFENVDPLNSYGILVDDPILSDINIKVTLYLKDKYGNPITSKVNQTSISVYASAISDKEIMSLTAKSESSGTSGNIEYSGTIVKNGDFSIKIFINDLPVECKGCNFRNSVVNKEESDKSILFLIGNKRRFPIFQNNNTALINKKDLAKNLIFYFEQRDKYGNEVKDTKSNSFTFNSANGKVDTSDISINSYGSNEDEKGFYKIDNIEKLKSLPDGLYQVERNSGSLKYKIYLASSLSESAEPDAQNSMIVLGGLKVFGKVDIPGSIVLDLRTKNYLRVKDVDKKKVQINNDALKSSIVTEGPEEGQLTVLLVAKKPGKYDFTVSYNNKVVITQTYTYICGCGLDKKLKYKSTQTLNDGNYVLFSLTDENGNECYNANSLKDLKVDNYRNNLITVKNGDKTYKTHTYMNDMTNTLILYLDRHASGSVTLSSDLITIDESKKTLTLRNVILDETHFYVKKDKSEGTLAIKPLDDNYEVISNYELVKSDFVVALINIVNDDFVVLKNDFQVADGLVVDISEGEKLINGQGKFLYIVYYRGKELFCENCISSSESGVVSKIKVYHKEGNNYIEANKDLKTHIAKMNFPFFKINLKTSNDNLVVVTKGVTVSLKGGEKEIDTTIKYASNGNIYVYLKDEGRSEFLSLSSMAILNLKVSYDKASFEANYYILNHHVKEPSSNELCAFGAYPTILNKQQLYIKRVDEDYELDIYLSDCASEEKTIFETLTILEKGGSTGVEAEVIPTDLYGGYLLFLPKSLPVTNSKYYYIVNNKSKSSPFELSIMPGYNIKSAELKKDKKVTESTADKLFTYFLVEFKDADGNVITNVGRNMFANDISGITVGNNLPYLLSYDEEEKAFRGQVPITGTGKIEVSSSLATTTLSLDISGPQFLKNSLFTLEEEKGDAFTFSVVLKDDYYKKLTSKDLAEYVAFKYFTYNPVNDEVFIISCNNVEAGESSTFKVTLDPSTPRYSLYGFIPSIRLIPQMCTNCFKKQLFQDFIFSVGEKGYFIHNLEKDQFLINKYDIPAYLYLSHKDITIDSSQMTSQKVIANKNTNVYLLSYKDGKSIKVDFSDGKNTKTLSVNLVDYSETKELSDYTGNEYVERYGLNTYFENNLNNKKVTFFIEVRDSGGKLVSTTPNLLIDNSQKEDIKKITVIKTSFVGVYLVKMSFYKSTHIKYYLKLTENQKNTDNYIKLNIKAAFPNQITLTNKERINQRIMRYQLLALNSNAEQICDERLNLYIDDSNLKSISKYLVFTEDVCSLYIQFYGDAVIKSTLENFSSEINNNENSLYIVNPHFSSLSVSPNVFSDDNSTLTLSFNEKSPSLSAYNKNEIIGNKKIHTYHFISPTKFKLVNSFSSLYSSEYEFPPDKFSLKQDNVYVLVGSILDTTIFPIFVHYQKPKTSTVSNLKAVYFSIEKKAYSLIELGQNGEKTESFQLNVPLMLILNFVDSKGSVIEMEPKNVKNLTASIVLSKNKVKKTIELNIRPISDIYFLVTIDSKSISSVKHLPSSFPEGETYAYNIKINVLDKEFLLPFYLKKNSYQTPSSLGNLYGFPQSENSLDTFSAKPEDGSTDITVFPNTQNIHHICLFITEKYDEESKSVIANKHLDFYNIELDTDCEVHFANSYMGCIDFSLNCEEKKSLKVKYNGKDSSSTISVNFMKSPSSFTFDKEHSTETFNLETTSFAKFLVKPEGSSPLSKEYYKIYINGNKVNKKDLSIFEDGSQVAITLSSKYFNAIPRTKLVKIIYDDGINKRQSITEGDYNITVEQKAYPPKLQTSYSLQVQPPLDIFAGDKLYFYLNVKDSEHACYYDDLKNLSVIEATTNIDNSEVNAKVTSSEKLIGNSKCEYVYIVNFGKTVETAGDLNVKLKDKFNTQNFKIYVSAKDIVASKSSFDGDNQITAGQIAHITFTSKDEFNNNINYFDLFKNFDIKLIDKDKADVEKDSGHYTYTKKVEPDNSKINIDIKINDYGLYYVKALINGDVLEISHKINVEYGACSLYGADPKVLPIDNRNTFYSGETIVIQIDCKDNLGNIVTEEGNAIFTANIKQIESDLIYKYTKTFEKGHHLITFTPPTVGNYIVDITLNGKKYGKTLEIPIESIDYSKYNCMDKRLVSNIKDCETNDYKKLLKDILGESYVCDGTNNEGKLFKCTDDSKKCVLHTNECGCINDLQEWNGFCYRSDTNPIKSLVDNKITCLSKLKSKEPNTTAVVCDDGSCRFNEKECTTKFECPIGFKVCGVKCILLNEVCKESVSCSNDEVLCWDLSCAKGYDLCPTRMSCPEDKVLCPDGSCQKSGYCTQPVKRSCEKNQYQCPDFSCVSSKSDCKKNIVCEPGFSLCEDGKCKESCDETEIPSNKYRCPNGLYVDNSQLCPSDMYIPQEYVKCPNGGVALNIESCIYVQKGISITCPKSKPILCPDFACVVKSSDCSPNIPTCPPHKPFKCWNNECRTSFDECPTPMECQQKTPILCQSGLCVKSVDECKEREEDTCPDYRCFDGTCVKSMELCPTHSYCGKGIKKCWNGACVEDINECRSPILDECSGEFTYRCPDGSCRKGSNECSTMSVCPAHLPIKCFDNSCRASINECPRYTSCGNTKVSCPDGTCALSFEDCNTIVTCYSDNKPFLCYDNSCKAQLDECPEPPKCTKNEVLCPNGACLSTRQNCKIFDPCEASNPIRCESNTCTNNYNDCNKQTKRCPIGYVLCGNGDCKTSEYLCDPFQCPKNKPYFCREGVCVNDKSLCDVIENGCPYNKPYKCKDGTCVENESKCDKTFECEEGLERCDDGSCLENKEDCPNINGCYNDRPFKCADGTCINPETTTCSIVLCPYNAPYKCPNGYCVSKASDCPNELRENDLNECKNGLIMCIDGRCVPSSDYCRPSFQCESGYTLCPDGTCRVSDEICPKEVKCPNGKHFCKNTNKCVLDEEDCNSMICPNGYIKCESNGQCVATQNDCDASPNKKTNGCPKGGVKCPNGRCLKSLSECSLSSNACPDDDAPYLCSNGECTDDTSKCVVTDNPGQCGSGKEQCPGGRCIDKSKGKSVFRTLCSNNIGCPLNKPYRCSNGECVESDRKCEVTTVVGESLMSNIVCDISKPYLCADKSCVSDPSFCKPHKCPTGFNTCQNGYCVERSIPENKNCVLFSGFCPISSPIHCPSGTCVDHVAKCSTSFSIPKCSEGEFYCARLNQCLVKKLDCLVYYDIEKEENKESRNLVENFVDPLNDEDFINIHKGTNKDLISLIEEDNSDKDLVDGTICYDGTIAKGEEKCPPVPACKMGEYRCENGGCASDMKKCYEDTEYKCKEGKKKCPDGMCHKNCNEVFYQGCEVGKYQCSNGLCVEDKYDCIGHSMCEDVLTPFRCMNSECKSSPSECPIIERLGNVRNLTYSFNRRNKIKFDFAFNENGRSIGSLEIPSQALLLSKNNNYSRLHISQVPSSILYKSELYNNTPEFLFNVSNSIPDSQGILNFENSVMSPVFKFNYDKNIDKPRFNISGRINMAHNEYEESGFNYSDYCLGRLKGYNLDKDTIDGDDPKWECVERQTAEGQTEFTIKDFGVYAIILNPLRQKINYFGTTIEKNFFLENVKYILIVLACIIVFVALVFYIFVRVTRYRQKYHENRAKILLLQQQKQEYENMTTDIFGQTLGDNINGIVYKANPAYTTTDEIKKSGTSLEDEIEKLQIECRNVNDQNERLQKDIADITDEYKILSASIENNHK